MTAPLATVCLVIALCMAILGSFVACTVALVCAALIEVFLFFQAGRIPNGLG